MFRGFPKSFQAAARACESDCETLLREVVSSRPQERLGKLDLLSQRLCSVVDVAELGRHVLPAGTQRREAEQVFGQLSGLISTLNTSPNLYESLAELTHSGIQIDGPQEEVSRTLNSTLHEFRAHGVHLEPQIRQKVVQLEGEISELSYQFGSLLNREALSPLLAARRELAQLLGSESYAEYALKNRLIASPATVHQMVGDISRLPRPIYKVALPVADLVISLDDVLACLRGLTEDVFGIPTATAGLGEELAYCWAPEMRALKVGEGIVFLDLLARAGKADQSATYMLSFDVANNPGGQQKCALVAGVEDPSHLTDAEVAGLFHEWGHVLAAVMGRTHFQQLAGTRTPEFDFVEIPSLVLERLAWSPNVLPRYVSSAWREAVSDRRLLRARQPIDYQVQLSLLDLDLHAKNHVVPTERAYSFTHLASYAASYYTYLVGNAVAGNILHNCLGESLSGGRKYRDKLLIHGGARAPLEMLRDCCGNGNPFDLSYFYDKD